MHGSFGYRMLSKTSLSFSGEIFAALQMLLDDTFVDKYTRDRSMLNPNEADVPKRLVLQRAECVQNVGNFTQYMTERRLIKGQCSADCLIRGDIKTMMSPAIKFLPDLDQSMNELWLFHGTTVAGA